MTRCTRAMKAAAPSRYWSGPTVADRGVQLAQIGAGAEAARQAAVDQHRARAHALDLVEKRSSVCSMALPISLQRRLRETQLHQLRRAVNAVIGTSAR